jgi:hypothetical protein
MVTFLPDWGYFFHSSNDDDDAPVPWNLSLALGEYIQALEAGATSQHCLLAPNLVERQESGGGSDPVGERGWWLKWCDFVDCSNVATFSLVLPRDSPTIIPADRTDGHNFQQALTARESDTR